MRRTSDGNPVEPPVKYSVSMAPGSQAGPACGLARRLHDALEVGLDGRGGHGFVDRGGQAPFDLVQRDRRAAVGGHVDLGLLGRRRQRMAQAPVQHPHQARWWAGSAYQLNIWRSSASRAGA
jgi:hypothetical protein